MLVNTDPRETLASAPMSTLQLLAVAITVGLTALDGFDVLSISFASPGIAAEWGIDRAALGVVLSMELIGMALGSILLGGVARDGRFEGRRLRRTHAAAMARPVGPTRAGAQQRAVYGRRSPRCRIRSTTRA